jgi:hypothetical protein
MEKGSSLPWWDVLYELTDGRTNRIDPDAILEYFRPLHSWLLKQNLTQEEWNCDNFLDRKHSRVKSYETRLNEIINGSSLRLPLSNISIYFLATLFYLFFRF